MTGEDGTIHPRAGEELPVDRVEGYLRRHLPDLPDGPLQVRQFPGGASNLTYLIRIEGWQAVLRRPPLGPLPPRAHDMPREARMLERIHPMFPLAPRPYLLCEDLQVMGAPFYVMERKRGVVLESSFPAGAAVDATVCRRLSCTAVDTLAEIHAVDWKGAGLDQLGHPDGFLSRQVRGWIDRYSRARTEDVPQAEDLISWLAEHVPRSPPPTLIHNDFKLNNMVLAGDDLARAVGVLDWEMATVGDPLVDLAVFLGYWVRPDDPEEMRAMLPAVTGGPGFLEREELMQRYAARTGRDLSAMDFYVTFARFKLAVILQQIYARWKRGHTRDQRFAGFGQGVRFLLQAASSTATRAGP